MSAHCSRRCSKKSPVSRRMPSVSTSSGNRAGTKRSPPETAALSLIRWAEVSYSGTSMVMWRAADRANARFKNVRLIVRSRKFLPLPGNALAGAPRQPLCANPVWFRRPWVLRAWNHLARRRTVWSSPRRPTNWIPHRQPGGPRGPRDPRDRHVEKRPHRLEDGASRRCDALWRLAYNARAEKRVPVPEDVIDSSPALLRVVAQGLFPSRGHGKAILDHGTKHLTHLFFVDPVVLAQAARSMQPRGSSRAC